MNSYSNKFSLLVICEFHEVPFPDINLSYMCPVTASEYVLGAKHVCMMPYQTLMPHTHNSWTLQAA